MLSEKLYFLEIGPVNQKLWPMYDAENVEFKFSRLRRHLKREKSNLTGFPSCHGINHSQTIFTIGILIKILAASTCVIDFFCKNTAASSFCGDSKFAFKSKSYR